MKNPMLKSAVILFLNLSVQAKSTDWDVLIFTQNWPPAVCQHYHETGNSHVCSKIKFPHSWSVHGVWPTKLGTLGPAFCDPNNKFDPSQIKDIIDDLESYWPGIEGDKGITSLWDHEWNKHGTCAMQLEQLSTEQKYFGKGLDWLHQYNISDILSDHGIIPTDGAGYPVQAFQDAVIKSLHVNPRIECEFEKKTRKPYLMEIRICFDKSLNAIDCDGTKLSGNQLLTNCPLVGDIRYSKDMPEHTGNENRDDPYSIISARRNFVKHLRKTIVVLVMLDWLI